MNLTEYSIKALSTASTTSSREDDAQHAGFGLMTETGEILDTYKRHLFYKVDLNVSNLKEEAGDVLWYLVLGYKALGREFPSSVGDIKTKLPEPLMVSRDWVLAKLSKHSADFFNIAMSYKGSIGDNYLEYDLDRVLHFLHVFVTTQLNMTLEDVADINIEKLSKRYPGLKFSQDKALNRDTENELSHI